MIKGSASRMKQFAPNSDSLRRAPSITRHSRMQFKIQIHWANCLTSKKQNRLCLYRSTTTRLRRTVPTIKCSRLNSTGRTLTKLRMIWQLKRMLAQR